MKKIITMACILAAGFTTMMQAEETNNEYQTYTWKDVKPYHEVVVEKNIQVKFVKSDEESITCTQKGNDFKWKCEKGVLKMTREGGSFPIEKTVSFKFLGINVTRTKNVGNIVRFDDNMTVVITGPNVDCIRLSGASAFQTNDTLTSDGDVFVQMSGATKAQIADIEAQDVNFQLSGSSKANANVNVTTATLSLSGSSQIEISGKADKHNIETSGSSSVKSQIENDALTIDASGSSSIVAPSAQKSVVYASGSSKIEMNGDVVSLAGSTSGAATIDINGKLQYNTLSTSGASKVNFAK